MTGPAPRASQPHPLGATPTGTGVDFSLYAPRATRLELLLFAAPEDPAPDRTIVLDPRRDRTGGYWHALVADAGPGQVYGYRVHGPDDPARGWRFDPQKLLLDPYARAVVNQANYDRDAARAPGDNTARALRAVVADPDAFAWEGDLPLPARPGRELIYELHVGGFTRDPAAGVDPARRGTYAGLIEKIPYLQALGVTAVELLPVHEFDPQDAPPERTNYWGYSSLAFFAPHAAYSSDRGPLGPVHEFRTLVRALHRAGIRVILDVVYNHTAEGGAGGPWLSWRGLANDAYYLLDRDRSRYLDYTGCGNTFHASHPAALRLILDSLRCWVREMHVDGFRFDLASALTRDEHGEPLLRPPLLRLLETDPVLSGTQLIAEAWDAGGLYQVGSFPAERFAEWNGPFRDDVRRFLRGDRATVEAVMARVTGSADLFRGPDDGPWRSINFVTCHDGFTLADLVTYNTKHNETNGEENHDGSDHNLSWNCGVEGPTRSPAIREVRRRQVRNFLGLLLLSHGTPMLSMGDEVLRTQRGNNNAYCQDNPLGWFDWRDTERHADFLRFAREMVQLRGQLADLGSEGFWRATDPANGKGHISWHGTRPEHPDWGPDSHSLAWVLEDHAGAGMAYVAVNAWWRPLIFTLPVVPANLAWHGVVDTAQDAPRDIVPVAGSAPVAGRARELAAHSLVVLVAR